MTDETDENDEDLQSEFADLAAGLVGGGDKGEELREEVDRLTGGAGGRTIDAFLSGAVGSTILGVSQEQIAEYVQQEAAKADGPIVHCRERETQAGHIAVRVYVSEPGARVFRGENSVLVKIGEWEDEQFLGFTPGRIEKVQGDGSEDTVTEFVVHPEKEGPAEESVDPPGDEAQHTRYTEEDVALDDEPPAGEGVETDMPPEEDEEDA